MLFEFKTRVRRPLPALATVALISLMGSASAQQVLLEPDQPAHLTAFGGKYGDSTFPQYYSDRNGVALELCTEKNDLAGACIFDPVILGLRFTGKSTWRRPREGVAAGRWRLGLACVRRRERCPGGVWPW
jgi:hypothetical protein